MEAGNSPDWLPAGWTEEVKVKNDRKTKCYIDPLTGRKFYTKPQVSNYLRTLQHNSSALQQKKTGTSPVSQYTTSELTGGGTYLKEEEPQNVKALKRTSCKSKLLQTGSSMQPVEEVFHPSAADVSGKVAGVSSDWLPAGWTVHVNGKKVKSYVDPLTGRKFYSKPQVSEYLRTVKQNSAASQQNKNADVCELTGGKTTMKPTGSQFRTRSSKQIDLVCGNESANKPKMDELSGGKTSLKEEKSQKDKTLKQTSCKSERKQTAKVVIESVTPDGLPSGWRKEIKIQKKKNGTRKDPYYTDPVSGYVFFSQTDALRYLETGDVNSCSIKPKKRDELGFLDNKTSAKMGELSGATNSQKLEGSLNANITKRKSRAFKGKPVGSAEQPVEKGVIERVATEGLPPGWLQETCYTDPASGYVFFSLEDALRYLETGDFDKCTVKPKKRDKLGFFNEDTSLNASELTRVKSSLNQEGSQNVITPKATRRVTKQREMGLSEVSIEKSNVVEITGGQPSLKRKGSQNAKTPESTSRLSKQKINGHSKQSVEHEMIERATPDGLPPGWIKEVRFQKKANGTRKDTYYTDPVSGYVFLSQKDALRYLKSGDIRTCAVRPKKRDELGFLNEASSLPSVAATQKIGDHTPKRQLFAGTENSVTRSLETADAGGPRKRQRIPKGELLPGTQDSVMRSLESADAGEPQKRPHTRKGKLSPGNAIEEGAGTKVSYDPSSSPPPTTKGSKRKRGKRVGTENSTAKEKDKSTNSKAKIKSNRKSETGASSSKRKTAVGVPSRSSSRLVGVQSKMVKSLETEPEPSVGPHDNLAHSSPHQFPIVSETEIADNALRGTEAPSNAELSNRSKNPLDDQAVAIEDQAVAFEDQAVAEGQDVAKDQPFKGESVIKDVESQDQENPFGESWSDPCLEFAFKTLSGEMPVKDNLPTHGNIQELSENPNPQAGGCLALLDFGVPNPYQNNNNVASDFNAQEDPVSNSGPISPTFLPSGNVSSLFLDNPQPVADSIPPGFAGRSPTFDAPSKPISDTIPLGFSAHSPISPGFSARSPTFDEPSKPVSDCIPPGFSVLSPIFDAPSKHVPDAAPLFPDSPFFLASGNASSPVFGAPAKHLADSVPQFPNSPFFLASGNVNSQSFHAPAKPESDSAQQLPTTHAFLAFGNVSSPNCTANAPQQPNWDDKDHRPNLNL